MSTAWQRSDFVVSNPTREGFFDNYAYREQKSLNNLAVCKKAILSSTLNIRSLQKIFDSLAQGWGNFCKSKAAFQITGNQLGRNLKQKYT